MGNGNFPVHAAMASKNIFIFITSSQKNMFLLKVYFLFFHRIEMLFKSKEVLTYFRVWGPTVQNSRINSIGNRVFCRSDSLFFYTKFKYTL